jgi:hypothetical protein
MRTGRRIRTLAKKTAAQKNATVQRLMARLTLLRHERPASQHALLIWTQQIARITRQLERYHIYEGDPTAEGPAENPPSSSPVDPPTS